MNWIIGIIVLVVVGYLLDREIYFYEAVHLGPRVQAWLYDRWSRKYDVDKRQSQLRDTEMLAHPLLGLLKEVPEPFVLDFATGTGRLSYVLLSQPSFNGHIIALDLSEGMLEQASKKLNGFDGTTTRVEFLRHVALPLPFPDEAFDVVCALEVLELFPIMDVPLKELTRVLRPGGIFLATRGTEESGRRAKVKSKPIFKALLEKYGLTNIQISTWWKLYDRVMAQKQGALSPAGRRELSDVLQCEACGQVRWKKEVDTLTCQHCGKKLSITKDEIVLN